MPSINRKIHKRPRIQTQKMARYQDIYQDKRWKRLRSWKVKNNPLCEVCLTLDPVKLTPVDEVHHIIAWQSGSTALEQDALAFDPDNLISLCIPHHKKRHYEITKKNQHP